MIVREPRCAVTDDDPSASLRDGYQISYPEKKFFFHWYAYICYVRAMMIAKACTMHSSPPSATASTGPGCTLYRSYTITLRHATLGGNDQPDAQTSTWKQTTLTRDIHASAVFEPSNPSKKVAADSVFFRWYGKEYVKEAFGLWFAALSLCTRAVSSDK